MSIRWEGDLIERLDVLRAKVKHADDAVLEGAKVIMDRSDMLVPKAPKKPSDNTPTLVSTGSIGPTGESNKVFMQYSSVYAHWVHEHLWFKHPYGGQAKFLETAMLEKADEALNKAAEVLFEGL